MAKPTMANPFEKAASWVSSASIFLHAPKGGTLDTVQIQLLRSLDDDEGVVLVEVFLRSLGQGVVQGNTLAETVRVHDGSRIQRVAHSLRTVRLRSRITGVFELPGHREELDGAK